MDRDYTLFIPEYVAAGSAVLIIALELLFPRLRRDVVAVLAAIAGLAYGGAALFWVGKDPLAYQDVFVVDNYTTFFRVLGGATVFVIALMSAGYIRQRARREAAEYYALLLTAVAAMGLMSGARELVTAYISLELLSFSLYILVGFLKFERRSNEASLKFILLGAFASALLLYGFSILYGVSGSTTYAGLAEGLASRSSDTDIAVVMAYVLVLAGIGFKIAAVPFHSWAPDAYEGAPIPITAMLSTLEKAAGFALLLRLFSTGLIPDAEEWRWAVVIIAAVTMVFGNLVAIQQTNVKRLIAYSSIGQVGYMLMALAAIGYTDGDITREVTGSLLLHLAGYIASTLLFFAAFTAWYNRTGDESIRGLRGMADTQPILAVALTAALFSFAGLPFFIGFSTKFFLFQAVSIDEMLWLVGLAVLMSFVSLYYYLMVVREMFMFDPKPDQKKMSLNPLLGGISLVLTVAIVIFGIWPTPIFKTANEAAKELALPSAGAAVEQQISADELAAMH